MKRNRSDPLGVFPQEESVRWSHMSRSVGEIWRAGRTARMLFSKQTETSACQARESSRRCLDNHPIVRMESSTGAEAGPQRHHHACPFSRLLPPGSKEVQVLTLADLWHLPRATLERATPFGHLFVAFERNNPISQQVVHKPFTECISSRVLLRALQRRSLGTLEGPSIFLAILKRCPVALPGGGPSSCSCF